MQKNPTVLSVNNNQIDQTIIQSCLSSDYDLTTVSSLDDARSLLKTEKPDLVLLDIEDVHGITLCEEVREEFTQEELPVFFLATLDNDHDRMRCYDAGGNDFLAKPYDIGEMQSKVKSLLSQKTALAQLKAASANASETAMTAMTYGSELGTLMGFFERSLSCNDLENLADLTLETCQSFGLGVSIQLRVTGQVVNRSDGTLAPLEEQLLNQGGSPGAIKIARLNNRCMFNAPYVSLFFKQMSPDDPRTGRLIDHMTFLLDACNARVDAIYVRMTAADRTSKGINSAADLATSLITEFTSKLDLLVDKVDDGIQDLELEVTETCDILALNSQHKKEIIDSVKQFSRLTNYIQTLRNELNQDLTAIPSELRKLI